MNDLRRASMPPLALRAAFAMGLAVLVVAPGRGQGSEGADPTVTAAGTLDWLTAARYVEARGEPYNPGNRVFQVPQLVASSELRPHLKLRYGSMLQAVIEPRLLVTASQVEIDGTWLDAPARSLTGDVVQLYLSWQVNDVLSVAYGYQNFQWGPAELVSPSDRMFRLVGYLRDPLYVVRGRNLARVNVNVGNWLSLVTLFDLYGNHDAAFVYGVGFQPSALAKLEVSAPSGAGYLGVTGGIGVTSRPWFGEYAAWAFTDLLSVYADASHTWTSGAWYPAAGLDGATIFERTDAPGSRVLSVVVAGLRRTFTGGADLRLEYLYNEEGYDRGQIQAATEAFVASPASPEIAGPYLAPGLEILARKAGYVSLRVPSLPPHDRLTVSARYLASLTDRSGLVFGNASVDIGRSVLAFATAAWSHGPSYGELSRFTRLAVVVGAVYTL